MTAVAGWEWSMLCQICRQGLQHLSLLISSSLSQICHTGRILPTRGRQFLLEIPHTGGWDNLHQSKENLSWPSQILEILLGAASCYNTRITKSHCFITTGRSLWGKGSNEFVIIELQGEILFSESDVRRRLWSVWHHDKMMTDNNENLSRTFIRFDHLF